MTKSRIIKNITGTVTTVPRMLANERLAAHLSFRLKEYSKDRHGEININDYLVNVYGNELRFSRLRSLPVGSRLRLTFITSGDASVIKFTPLAEESEKYFECHLMENVKISLRKPRRTLLYA